MEMLEVVTRDGEEINTLEVNYDDGFQRKLLFSTEEELQEFKKFVVEFPPTKKKYRLENLRCRKWLANDNLSKL